MSQLEDDLLEQLYPDLPIPVREYRFHPVRRWRFDFAFIEEKLAVEVDGATYSGGRHTRGGGIEKDAEKQNLAAIAGWRMLRITRKMIEDGRAVQFIQLALRKGDDDGTTSSD